MDFRRPEAMADVLLHPQDRAYTVPELYAWLDRCGMSFGRWIEQAPYLAQCGMVARSPHAARLASLPSRLQHAAVELFRGTMVSHSFIAYRDDRTDASQPIRFAGDAGATTSPLRCHGRRAFGNAASWQRRGADKPVAQIHRSYLHGRFFRGSAVGASTGTEPWGKFCSLSRWPATAIALPRFFERLWRYDQIVFDASRAVIASGGGETKYVFGRQCKEWWTETLVALPFLACPQFGMQMNPPTEPC